MPQQIESLEARRLLAGTAAISGSVYTDLNANARHEAGEAGMKAVRVYLDANNNGAWDSRREASVLSDKRGQYRFDGLNAGTHRLREVTPANHRISGPRSGWFKITLTEGQHVARRQFANSPVRALGDISGLISGGTTTPTTDTYIEYTFNGDTDLNGVVNFDDYARTDHGFSDTGSFSGDFDFNGSVNFDDYSLIDQAFNSQGKIILTTSPGSQPPRPAPTLNTPALVLNAKEQAIADVATNVKNKTLSNAVSWLSGNKNVTRSAGVQAAIDGYQKFGIEYKREFLKIANS